MELLIKFLPNFLLVFCRITAFFVVAPVFSSRGVPGQFKVGIAFFVSLLTYVALGGQTPMDMDGAYVLVLIREILIGLLIGFIAFLFFTAVQVAGSFIDMQMGFGIANVIDPMTGAQSPIMGQFKYMIAMLLFLSMNGHHYLLLAVMQSYNWVPLSNHFFAHVGHGDVSDFLIKSFAMMFYVAFQMAAPLVVSLFLVDVALGILARTVPQFNIFVVGVPLKIIVGFMVLIIVIPGFLYLFQSLFQTMFESIHQMMLLLQK